MITVERQPWREMVNHAQATYPNECCGAMIGNVSSGPDGDLKTVVHAIALDNASSGPQAARYELRPEDLLKADREARERKMDLIGIYHSHPDCGAYFSETDLKNSCPWYSFVVLSIKNGKFDHANSFLPDLDQTAAEPEEMKWPRS
jgi:proteasome lid subunit RPN8/RPN11